MNGLEAEVLQCRRGFELEFGSRCWRIILTRYTDRDVQWLESDRRRVLARVLEHLLMGSSRQIDSALVCSTMPGSM